MRTHSPIDYRRFRLVALAVFASAVPSGLAVAEGSGTNWGQFHRSAARTGFDPSEHRIGPANVGRLAQTWSTSVGELFSRGPVVSRGLVIDGTVDGRLVAVRARNGAAVWTTPQLGPDSIGFPPAVAGGTVYLAYGSTVQAFSATTGRRRWITTVGGSVGMSSSAIVGRTLYTGSDDGRVYALDTRTGALRWASDTGASIQASVAVDSGRVVASTMDGALTALRASDGRRLWRASADAIDFGGGPAMHHGVVYIAGDTEPQPGARISAYRARDGRLLWSTLFPDDIHSIPAVAYGRVFIGGIDGGVHAFRATDGTQVWNAGTSGGEVWASIAIANHVAFLTTDTGHFLALATGDGTQLADLDVSSGQILATVASPAIVDGTVYIGVGNGTLRAFRVPGR